MLKPVTIPIKSITGYFQPGTKPIFRLPVSTQLLAKFTPLLVWHRIHANVAGIWHSTIEF
jgi:hypothetical protein